MPDKTNSISNVFRLPLFTLVLMFLLQFTVPVFAQGSIMEIPAPKKSDRFNLLENAPPIWVKLKDWYCMDTPMGTYLEYELNRFIGNENRSTKLTPQQWKNIANNSFTDLDEDYNLDNFSNSKGPKYGPFNPSPGFTEFKSVNHCYTQDELLKWFDFIKKVGNHIANHSDPLKEAKRLLPNFK